MPALFAQSAMHPSAKLMAFQDDVYVVSSPPQVAACHTHLERELWAHAGIRINLGKTQIYNRAGVLPPDCQHIIRAGRQLTPPVVVWWVGLSFATRSTRSHHFGHTSRAFGFCEGPTACEGLGTQDSVESCRGYDRPSVRVAHSLFLLRHKGELLLPHHPARGVRRIRSCPRHRHQQGVQPCKPSRLGVGLRNAVRGAQAAYWSSWADSLHMIRKRHRDISDFITVTLGRGGGGPHAEAAGRCRESLVELGLNVPEWGDLARGLRPDFDPAADQFPSLSRNGQKVSNDVENVFLARSVWPTLAQPSKPSSVPSRDRWQASLSSVCLFLLKQLSSLRSSGYCFLVASGNLCPCLRSPADAADHSTLVAIIAQRVR